MAPMILSVLIGLLTDRVFVLCFLSWFLAQTIKFCIHWYQHRTLDRQLYLGITSGGMPSSHTSLTTTFAALMYLEHGQSSMFLLSLLLMVLTMHYVLLLNKHTAEHAKLLNLRLGKNRKALVERVGHKPQEVIAGFVLGLLVALLY